MLFKATGNKFTLSDMQGWSSGKVAEVLDTAIKEMETNYREYEKMNPPNGWGSLETFLAYLNNIKTECRKNPDFVLEVY